MPLMVLPWPATAAIWWSQLCERVNTCGDSGSDPMTSADSLLRTFAAVLAAVLFWLIVPPFGLHWLNWISLVPILWALRKETPRANIRYGFIYGFFSIALLFQWVAETVALFGDLPMVAAIGILALFAALFGAPYILIYATVHPLRERLGVGWIAVTPAVAVLTEYLTSLVTLFPFQHGSTLYRVPTLIQLASITGVWGLTYLIYLVNCALAEAIYRRREGNSVLPIAPWVATALVLGAVLAFGTWRVGRVEAVLAEAPTVRIAQLQMKFSMIERLVRGAKWSLRKWVAATRLIEPGSADIVVWSEAAYPYFLNETDDDTLAELAREGRFELIVGAGAREPVPGTEDSGEFNAFNTVYFFDAAGQLVGRYNKMIPVPFGEYMPFGSIFPGLNDFVPTEGIYVAGDVPTVVEGAHLRVATPICYEAIFGRVCNRFERPDILVNVVNDGWFGESAATHQHAMLAAIRATELGVPVFRAAYSGVSMVVEPHGVIRYETEPYTDVSRVVPVRIAKLDTVYGRLGDWFVVFCFGLLVGAVFVARRFTRLAP